MQINTVKQQKEGFLVNNSLFVPNDPKNTNYQEVQEWIINGGIVESEFSLEELKQAKIYQLNKNREEYCLIPIEYNGNTYASTEDAKISITYNITLLPTLSTEADYYTYPQGEPIILTKADFKAIATLIQDREIYSRNLRKTKKDEINNASTIEELETININFI